MSNSNEAEVELLSNLLVVAVLHGPVVEIMEQVEAWRQVVNPPVLTWDELLERLVGLEENLFHRLAEPVHFDVLQPYGRASFPHRDLWDEPFEDVLLDGQDSRLAWHWDQFV